MNASGEKMPGQSMDGGRRAIIYLNFQIPNSLRAQRTTARHIMHIHFTVTTLRPFIHSNTYTALLMGGKESNKRKRGGDAYKNAYENVSMARRQFAANEPGTPRSLFKDSYDVTISPKQQQQDEEKFTVSQLVIHQHANGLCIVTVGDARMDQVKSVTFQVHEAPQSMSANHRRKVQQKMLRGGTPADSQGLVTPHTILAHVTLENENTIQIPAGVWGTVLELNTNVTPELLKKDPLLDGHLAIIMPTGVFPPPMQLVQQDESDEEPRKKLHVTTTSPDDNE